MKKLFLALMMFAPLASFAQKFGHVNSQEIIQAMPEYNKAKTEVDALHMPENIRQRREMELQEMYQKIQQSYQDNQQALAKASQEKMQVITTKVVDAIKQVGQAGGYVYIMDVAGGIPYISTTLSTDVTADVKAKLGLK